MFYTTEILCPCLFKCIYNKRKLLCGRKFKLCPVLIDDDDLSSTVTVLKSSYEIVGEFPEILEAWVFPRPKSFGCALVPILTHSILLAIGCWTTVSFEFGLAI